MHTTQPTPGPDRQSSFALPTDAKFAERYEVLEEVGRGGMGVVYRARHKVLDRPVAIKIMLPSAASDRFLREAQLLAKIRSPYVVGVHDFDVLSNGCPMLVMEWVAGTDLQKFLRAQTAPIPEETVLPWMR